MLLEILHIRSVSRKKDRRERDYMHPLVDRSVYPSPMADTVETAFARQDIRAMCPGNLARHGTVNAKQEGK